MRKNLRCKIIRFLHNILYLHDVVYVSSACFVAKVCENIKFLWKTRFYPNCLRFSGTHLKICTQGFTCCTSEMESQLWNESDKDYQRVLQDKLIGLRHTFESRTSKFDRKLYLSSFHIWRRRATHSQLFSIFLGHSSHKKINYLTGKKIRAPKPSNESSSLDLAPFCWFSRLNVIRRNLFMP